MFCIPYAGAGAAAFRHWSTRLPPSVEVVGIQAPGRAWRISEPPIIDLLELATSVADAVAERADCPFAVFGHSYGAWVGWEAVRQLESKGLRPVRLVTSGRQAPAVGALHAPLGHLDDDQFLEAVQTRYGGIPDSLFDEPDVLEFLLPALRADFVALESYDSRTRGPIRTPITSFCGAADTVAPPSSIAQWFEATVGRADVRVLPGGHFPFEEYPSEFFDALNTALHPHGSLRGG